MKFKNGSTAVNMRKERQNLMKEYDFDRQTKGMKKPLDNKSKTNAKDKKLQVKGTIGMQRKHFFLVILV